MDFSLSTTSAPGADRELARVQHETALVAYGEKSGETDWKLRVTTDAFFQETPELRNLLQPETWSVVSLREGVVSGLLAVLLASLVWMPDWSFWRRGPVVEMPRADVPPLLVEQMPVSMRQRAEGFNKRCVERQWTEAWKELTTLCKELPQSPGLEPRQALRERLYLLAMNRASGDLDESSRAPAWLDLDDAENKLFPPPEVAPNLSDEALVAFLRVAHLRKVKPVLDKGLDGGRPAPTVTRKELSDLGNAVRELHQRRAALSKDSQQRLDLVDAAVHLTLVWTMTTADVGAPVIVRRDPKPIDDPETKRWWDRLHDAIFTVEKDSSISGQHEWKLLRKGFWLTLDDFTWKPFINEDIHLGSKTYKELKVESGMKAAQ